MSGTARLYPASGRAPGTGQDERRATRIVYTDLDGTMVGPWGCFFRAADAAPDLGAARALVDLLAAEITLVLVSGRTRPQELRGRRLPGLQRAVSLCPSG